MKYGSVVARHLFLPSFPPRPSRRRRDAALQVRRRPLLHNAVSTVPDGLVPGDGKGKPSPKHKIRHTIETTGRPVFAKARPMDLDKLRKAEAEFHELEAAGIICR
jgi:hypothetical protein